MRCPYCNNEMFYNVIGNSYECLNCKLSLSDLVDRPITTNVLQVPHYEIHCLICGELVKKVYEIKSELQQIEVCEKCKKAIMKMREKVEE